MRASAFDELAFFRAIHQGGARALLIGRGALVLLGLPVLTADYDFWLAMDDIETFNAALASVDFHPTDLDVEAHPDGRLGEASLPIQARRRYALENDEHVDVLIARGVSTVDGEDVRFDYIWTRRRSLELAPDVLVTTPALEDLVATKRFSAPPKDLEDIRLLEALRGEDDGG